ncbi:hypothetical protein, partial [Adlercreutzia sp. DFI.6.23]|uniref:hypothetical protein n=1 Tax=Adlercreutzia sp. DFI.6.23 TaxID=2963705 RepID=UPI00210EDF14
FATDNAEELTLTPKGRYLVVVMMRQFFIGVNNPREPGRAGMVKKYGVVPHEAQAETHCTNNTAELHSADALADAPVDRVVVGDHHVGAAAAAVHLG